MGSTPPPHDIAYFDGSADPNPGGRMGLGWLLLYRDGSQRTGAAERAPAPGNTNNVAEYLALIAALKDYTQQSGEGPLLVHGDSQLVVLQMTGEWGVNSPTLYRLHQQAQHLANAIAGAVRFAWVPREQNRVADQLASGVTPGAPSATLIYAATPATDVSQGLAKHIAALNVAGRASFKECLQLRVGGFDSLSAMRLPALTTLAGNACVALCEAAFPQSDPDLVKARESALRWALRGLAMQLAIRKVQVDREMRMNAQKRR